MEYIKHFYAVWWENVLAEWTVAITISVVVVTAVIGLAIVTKLVGSISQRKYEKSKKIAEKQREQENKRLDHEKHVNEVVWGNKETSKSLKNKS
jgi:hypothetical protein